MNYLSQISFFFGAIGAFNSLIFSLFLLFNKSYARLQNRLFGLFLFVLSVRVIHSLFYAFSDDKSIWTFQSGPAYFFLISPLLFSYIVSVLNPVSSWIKYWKYHILFWILVVFTLVILFPFKANVRFNKEVVLPIIYAQWLLYILTSAYFLIREIYIKGNISIKLKWLTVFLTANLILWISFALVKFEYFITGSLVFSLIFYGFFLFLNIRKDIFQKIFEKEKIKKKKVSSNENKEQIGKLKRLMNSEKLFKNPNLKIADIAEKLDIPSHELSKIINENLHKNFTDFINEYRVEEAKELIQENSLYTIEAIGNQSGFNSKSAFYKAFKKITNTTPAKFKT